MSNAEWIWLNASEYPAVQTTKATVFDAVEVPYAMVQFRRKYRFAQKPEVLTLYVSGDCRYRLLANGHFLGMGPAFAGGDWARSEPMPQRYYDTISVPPEGDTLLLEAEVQLPPTLLCDISNGHGGFYLQGNAVFPDGSVIPFGTDDTWSCRPAVSRRSDLLYDDTLPDTAWRSAEVIRKPLPLPSEIPALSYEVLPLDCSSELEKIVSGTLLCEITADAPFEIRLIPFETPDLEDEPEVVRGNASLSYEGFRIRSVGGVRLEVLKGKPKITRLAVRSSRYPGECIGRCETGRQDLDAVLSVCEHTLAICRQSIHLDSPRHMEPLGCTGDYRIESLMGYYLFSDHRLARFDLVRTARLLKATDGRMFHTGYSLMWVSMLKEYVLYTGDNAVLPECAESIRILLRRFETYEGSNGLLDDPPDYMFADWVEIGGYSMHHPPKALGQTILNALYYMALLDAGYLLADDSLLRRAAALRSAFDQAFWNSSAGYYISGRTGETAANAWLPQNAKRTFFTLHANAMAVACGICSGQRAKALMKKALSDSSLPDYQPYFAHFVLQALWNTGLFDAYAIPILERWIPLVRECPKGLAEGWIKPCDGYVFDHSHAWGGCPRYWLPRALIGLEILEPGFRAISLLPRLTEFPHAFVSLPTPYGLLECEVNSGSVTVLRCPEEIKIV